MLIVVEDITVFWENGSRVAGADVQSREPISLAALKNDAASERFWLPSCRIACSRRYAGNQYIGC